MVGLSLERIDGGGLHKKSLGFFETALLCANLTEPSVSRGVLGPQTNHPREIFGRRIQLPQPALDLPEAKITVAVARIDFDSAGKGLPRLLVLRLALIHDAEIVVDTRVVTGLLQRLLQGGGGFGVMAVVGQGDGELAVEIDPPGSGDQSFLVDGRSVGVAALADVDIAEQQVGFGVVGSELHSLFGELRRQAQAALDQIETRQQ